KDNYLNCIKEINSNLNTTVFLTSHDMDDIEKICSRIIVLNKGKILFDGNIRDIKDKVGDYHILKLYIDDYDIQKDIYKIYHNKEVAGGTLELKIDKNEVNIADIVKFYFSTYTVKDISIQNNGLEQLIKELYGESHG
ncbi:MAG: hypothetical protein K6G26_05505, partial [Lachnospiraceae bacterium]|nr:hypothetical protein [Lachnospiraceae bacterium]